MQGDIRKSVSRHGYEKKKKIRNSSCERYFEDWKQVPVLQKRGGRIKNQWVYTGKYYRQDVSKKAWVLIRFLYITFFLCSAVILIKNGIKPQPFNTVWYVTLPEALCVAGLAWILIAFIVYLPSRNLTVGDYKFAVKNMRRSSAFTAIVFLSAAFMMLLFLALHSKEEPREILLCAAEFFLTAGMNFVIFRMESAVKYIALTDSDCEIGKEGEE